MNILLRILLLLPACLLLLPLSRAQDKRRILETEEVTVKARRILKDVGARKTILDTSVLRENISYSLADVLSQSSSIFIKSYGRATLSTASFRGTAPSHTQVLWNGMKLNSPMLGMVDFSLIPSFFIDNASLHHGAGSVGVTGGGLGGAVSLVSDGSRDHDEGVGFRYIQGISSFSTYDQFARLDYGKGAFRGNTRAFYVSSKNDFKYTNYRKKDFEYNDHGEIVGYSYPREKNKNGSFKDLHLMQEFSWDAGRSDRVGLSVWYMDSRRGVPMLSVDYKDENNSKNKQYDHTVRAVANWDRERDLWSFRTKAGYSYTDLKYVYLSDIGSGELKEMIHSRSYVNTGFGEFDAQRFFGNKWLFTGKLAAHQHLVKSADRAIMTQAGEQAIIGYDKARFEASGFLAVKYMPTNRVGLSVNLREERYGTEWTPPIPAFFAEYLLWRPANLYLKGSFARNFRYPTLNDLYFMPGGNDSLRNEQGYTYDIGLQATIHGGATRVTAEVTAYDSYIRDWIVWLPTFKGFWSPVNVKKVHSSGVEAKVGIGHAFGDGWFFSGDVNYTWSRAINRGDPMSWADESIGKQLVYIPKHSASATGHLDWKGWRLTYKWNYYSERFTTSSNEKATKIGRLKPYFMNDAGLEKSFTFPWARISCKLMVNNLFNEEYESVLSRPMAGRNYGFFIELNPFFKR